jgi:RHS repeat-associated protein
VFQRKFIYGPGIDEPICLIDATDSNAVYYYHFDGLGSVVALSDVNNVPVERYAYDVFGRPTIRDVNDVEIAESALANPYLFTGRAWDPETALYYYRARYYDYFTGRFLQTDPIGYVGGLNLHTYCGNNPLNRIDPMGLYTVDDEGNRHYDYFETQMILLKGKVFPHQPLKHGIPSRINLNKLGNDALGMDNLPDLEIELGCYDFGYGSGSGDTFEVVRGEQMAATSFGNYFAGHMAMFHYGPFGYLVARSAGNFYEGTAQMPWYLALIYGRDDPQSVKDINSGSLDALYDRLHRALSPVSYVVELMMKLSQGNMEGNMEDGKQLSQGNIGDGGQLSQGNMKYGEQKK